MKVYDLYGIACSELEEAKGQAELALGVDLQAHESGHHCGDYYRHDAVGQEHLILHRNFDSFEAEWTEPEHQDQAFLLYVNETSRSAAIRTRLENLNTIRLLRHQEL